MYRGDRGGIDILDTCENLRTNSGGEGCVGGTLSGDVGTDSGLLLYGNGIGRGGVEVRGRGEEGVRGDGCDFGNH